LRLAEGASFVLAVIVSRSGPAPLDVGTRMVVCKDASIIGTIGVGLLEAQVRDLAMEVFSHRKPVLRKFSFTAEQAAEMCMICGGAVEVLVHFVDASQSSNLVLYQQIVAALRALDRAWLITEIPPVGGDLTPAQCMLKSDGTRVGQLAPGVAQALMPLPHGAKLVSHQGNLLFTEPLRPDSTAFIFGAGHISQELAPLARLVGFRTVVLDDRKDFANRERFQPPIR